MILQYAMAAKFIIVHGTDFSLIFTFGDSHYVFYLFLLMAFTARYTPLEGCIFPLPSSNSGPGYRWPQPWPRRLKSRPTWLSESVNNLPSFEEDTESWGRRVSDFYLQGLSLNWSSVRNIMDMNAGYGGFAAALIGEPVWVMNVVPVNGPDTLPTIFERGLIGIYHDWCESFNTYPRTYDLLHAYDLFTNLPQRCDMIDTVVEMDRILRPEGWALIKDSVPNMKKLKAIMLSLHWKIYFQNSEFLVGRKGNWQPTNVEFN
ncbi:putative methyltransferase [Nymphaea thermarum]|nr:putative methyltransferase [Nymphaea thermarum]